MPSVAIYGDSGMGKTMIMKRFRDEHPPSFNPLTGTLKTPVLAMEMTSRPGERRFYAELLTLLGAPQRPRADIAQMEQAALRIMEAIGVQVLVIDEVHNILAGTYREQRIVLNTLRFLSNRLQISLVCFGVNDAREAISGDVQLARRFEQFTLSRWAANEQFETLVASILRNTPLRRPSVLTPKSLRRILQITEGITASIFHIINSLAVDAIESGRECRSRMKRLRTGSRSSMPRRHSHNGEHTRTAIAGAAAAPFGRTSVVLDQSPCRLLRGPSACHASALPSRGAVAAQRRPPSQRRSPGQAGQHVRHPNGRLASHDLHQCAKVVASAHRRETGSDLRELQPSWRGTVANPAKPVGGMADHLPALRNIAARARRW